MVTGFTGLPGAGKTYWAVREARDAILAGRDVYANFDIIGARKFSDLQQVLTVRNGVIIIDEINLVCPSRWWNKFPPELAYFWSQTRKFGLDIFWTAQHVDRVDKIIREISNYVWKLKKMETPFGSIHFANKFQPELISREGAKSEASEFFFIRKSVYQNYDTSSPVDISFGDFNFLDSQPSLLPLTLKLEQKRNNEAIKSSLLKKIMEKVSRQHGGGKKRKEVVNL